MTIKLRLKTRPHVFPGCRLPFIPLERQSMLRLIAYQQAMQQEQQEQQQQHLCPLCVDTRTPPRASAHSNISRRGN